MVPVYYALTTTNPYTGYTPLAAYGTRRCAVEVAARAIIGPTATETGTDPAREAEQVNLVVVPASRLRHYGWTREAVEAAIDAIAVRDAEMGAEGAR